MQIIEVTKEYSPIPTSWIIDMYVDYINKLKPYNKDLQQEGLDFKEIATEEVEKAIESDSTELLLFCDEKINSHIYGLAIVGQYPNAYSVNDIYIQEFYINEKRRGLGREGVSLIMNRYNKLVPLRTMDISLFILEENFPARLFWRTVMEELGYKDLAKEKVITPPGENMLSLSNAELKFEYWRKTYE